MRIKMFNKITARLLLTGVSLLGTVLMAQESSFQKTTKQLGLDDSGKGEIFSGPKEANTKAPTEFKKVDIQEGDFPLPINFASAMQLSDARPLIIDAARAAELVAAAQLQRANVLWLPNIYAGIDYYRHDGQYPFPGNPGQITNSRQAVTAGPGLSAIFATTDAIYEPLSARQILKARQYEIQAAKNDALMEVAVAYFNVQQSRGRLAGAIDTVTKGKELVRKTEVLSKGLAAPVEIDRSRTLLAEL
ncbi:MAG: TolC family protein, partial [Planctomycetia bacterium]|nr:TolC family protein [Planctomycetia bacterium]